MFITVGKIYDAVEYNDILNTIKVYNDLDTLKELRIIIPLNEGEEIIVFQDATPEYRNNIIDEILI